MKSHVILWVLFGLWATAAASGDYKYVTYDKFMAKLERLKASQTNGHLFKFYDGFERYQVSPRPRCGPGDTRTCKNPVIEVANFHKGTEFVNSLPIVLLIGGFHGDEVVGTNALFYLVELIESRYYRDPQYANLLDNVRLMILPMANVNGFYHLQREEVLDGRSHDPNRDFPYNLLSNENCFKTSTALLLDAIFRKNLIVGCITYHGGDNSISFPWGNYAHRSQPLSPDHEAFQSIADMLRKAGSNNPSMGVQTYDIGTMHKVVYDVRGGFEDWAYAASGDKTNVNAACALHDNPSQDLFREKVSYDLTSNRALVFLVEAGYNKIPDEIFLGNEASLVSGNAGSGKWGHVTRNINIALRLAETMRPHAALTSISYSNTLQAVFSVKGCVQIDSLLQEKWPLKEIRREKVELTNEWRLHLQFEVTPGTTRSLSFGIVCDKNFGNPTAGKNPITHFTKLRTTKDYFLNFQGNRLRSSQTIRVTVLNVRTDLLNNALISWNPGNVNSLTYTSTLRSAPTAKSRSADQVVHINYGEGSLHVQTLATAGNNRQKELSVRKYGAMSSQWARNAPRHLVSLRSGDDRVFSPQAFLDLVGKDVDVYHEKSNQILYTHTLFLDSVNPYEEEMNALFIPASGVNCRSEEGKSLFFFVEAVLHPENDLKVKLITDSEEFFGFKVGNLKHDFELDTSVRFEGRWLSQYRSKLTVAELDDLRLLGRTLELVMNKKSVAFTCQLSTRDPEVGRAVEPEVLDDTAWVYQEQHHERRNNALILLFFAGILAAALWYGIRLRQSSFSEKSEKDLQVIINQASEAHISSD